MNSLILTSYANGTAQTFTFGDIDYRQGSLQDKLSNALIGDNLSIDELTFIIRSRKGLQELLFDSENIALYDINNERLASAGLNYPRHDFTNFAPYKDTIQIYHGSELQGVYYVRNVKKIGRDGGYTFSAVSVMGLLDVRQHLGGVYSGVTAGSVIAEIMGNIPYSIDGTLSDILLYGWLPVDTSRNNLKQILFACGASVMKDENGSVLFTFNLPQTATAKSIRQVYAGSSRDEIAPATKIKLTEHSFFASAQVDDEIIFDNTGGAIAAGETIFFAQPYHTLIGAGISIISSGANWAKISGTGTITGKPYVHIQRILEKTTGAAGELNELTVDKAYMVNSLNSAQMLDRLSAYYAQSEEITADVLTASEKPGSLIQIPDPNDYRSTVRGYIKTMARSFSSTIKSSVKLTQNWKPGFVGNAFDSFLIVTGDDLSNGTWTVPAALRGKRALVVLFGGSQGGQGGWYGDGSHVRSNGSKYGSVTLYNNSFDRTGFMSKPYPDSNAGCDGGAGGKGGKIGKMLQINVAALANSYPVTFGEGGEGGAGGRVTYEHSHRFPEYTEQQYDVRNRYAPQEGTFGTHSLFDAYDTDDGSDLVGSDYINLVTGEVLVSGLGPSGIAGARGGDGGRSEALVKNNDPDYEFEQRYKGSKGGSVGSYTGGNGAVGKRYGVFYSPRYTGEERRHYGLNGGGGGGGAAMGANGYPGAYQTEFQRGKYSADDDDEYEYATGKWSEYIDEDEGNYEYVKSANGGNGATATIIPEQVRLGGGQGGHGGGGGGGCGQPLGDLNIHLYIRDGEWGYGSTGRGGNGAKGGKGGNGFMVVYYKAGD